MKTFLCSYRFDGGEWAFDIKANSKEEAKARLAAIKAWGRYDGELMATIPAGPGAGFFVSALCWARNAFARP